MTQARAATDAQIRKAAWQVLRDNDLGHLTTAAPHLYPHLWSWDAAFVAIGLARVDVPRAIRELETLLAAQWSTGMIPHIVFSDDETGYFPGPDRWGTDTAAARPVSVRTSGICQPPVHAIALRHIVDRARENGGADQAAAEDFLARSFDGWLAWHRWLASARDPQRVGLVEIHHGWESGFDNSPRWDGPYARVRPGPVEPFVRRDTLHVSDPGQRPDDLEYTKYLWLVQQLASVDYDDERAASAVDFRVRDVFFSAILAAASDVLADLGDDLSRPDEAAELREIARRFRDGVASTVDPADRPGPRLRRPGRRVDLDADGVGLRTAGRRWRAGPSRGPTGPAHGPGLDGRAQTEVSAAALHLPRQPGLPAAEILARAGLAVSQPAPGLGLCSGRGGGPPRGTADCVAGPAVGPDFR